MRVFEEYIQPDFTIDVIWDKWIPDYPLFFGPIVEGTKPFVTTKTNIGEILVELQLVESKSWCRKNNWYRELTPGYNEIVFGSKRYKLCLLIGEWDGNGTGGGRNVQGNQSRETAA